MKNKKMAKKVFNIGERNSPPCNMARSWHWFHHVTAPCNVACGSGIVTVNSLFTTWKHPAMWYVALGWHAI